MNNIRKMLNIPMMLSVIIFSFVAPLFPAQDDTLSYKEGIEQIVEQNDVEVVVSSSSKDETVRVKESITVGLERI